MAEIVIPDNHLSHINMGDTINKESSLIYESNGEIHTIDLARCAEDYHFLHSNSRKCVAETNILDYSITFYTSGVITKISFKKRIYFNFQHRKLLSGSRVKRFHELVKLINKCGYTTYDLT
ncbi:MAG: hypothetical protein K2O28_04075 [Clostridia bacterium]|nr:hypothetical protein [Clostridia bacterium]